MTSGKSVMPSLGHDEEGNLQIYIPKRDFGEFIQGLLSQPRSIRKRWTRLFDVDHAFIRHLNELIKQRVQSQQISSVVSFQASIYFFDGRVQVLPSWEAFDAFNDNSNSFTTRLEIIWSYLVKCPAKPIPEKQTISITMNTGIGNSTDSIKRNDIFVTFIRWFVLDEEDSEIAVRIEYTELTWGVDVLRHLEADIVNKFIIEYWWVSAIRSIASLIGLFIIPALFGVPLLIYFLVQQNSEHNRQIKFHE